jgi:predicted class III extradiol MEMO1 family dioxygenase
VAKLTKKQRQTIQNSLDALRRAQAYIVSPEHHILIESQCAAFPEHAWTNGHGVRAIAISKEFGSDLVGLPTGIHTLEQMLKVDEASK